jgi:hypothetical protein
VTPGAVAFTAPTDFGSCSTGDYILIDEADCPDPSCTGTVSSYALCDGTSYSQCVCGDTPPDGFDTAVTDPGGDTPVGEGDDGGDGGAPDAAGADTSTEDAATEDGAADAGGGDDGSAEDGGSTDSGTD